MTGPGDMKSSGPFYFFLLQKSLICTLSVTCRGIEWCHDNKLLI